MEKWADYLISEVSYDSEHLISVAIRHKETDQGITSGKPIDRLTIASDIKNGSIYVTIYSGKNSWKKGHKIQTFSIGGNPYLRIDGNKVKFDFLGDIREFPILKYAPPQSESQPEPITEPESSSSPRGSLPKDSTEELPQELDLVPEPITEPKDEEATPEQLARLEQLEKQIKKLESQPEPITEPKDEEATPEQLARLEQLEKQIKKLESQPEPITEPESSSSPRGSLPKDSTEELPQELDLVPEPIIEPKDEEATPEQFTQLNDLQQQINDLENVLSTQVFPESETEPKDEEATPEQFTQLNDLQQEIDDLENVLYNVLHPSDDEPTSEQISRVKELEKEIEKLEAADIEHEIIQTLRKQDKKLDDIEKKLQTSVSEKTSSEPNLLEAYCVKCKTKRPIKNPQETTMKNGRNAVKGNCSVCNCKVFRIIKMKK